MPYIMQNTFKNYEKPEGLSKIEELLWEQWVSALIKEQANPHYEDYDIQIRDNTDLVNRALNGEWDEVCVEIEDNSIDWRMSEDDSARRFAFDNVVAINKQAIKDLIEESEEELWVDEVIESAYEKFDESIKEVNTDLINGYSYSRCRFVGKCDVKICIPIIGTFAEQTDLVTLYGGDECINALTPNQIFMGVLSALNINPKDFSDMWKQFVTVESWLLFEAAMSEASRLFKENYGLAAGFDADQPSAVATEDFCKWMKKMLEAHIGNVKALMNGLECTVSLDGSALTELVDNMAYASASGGDLRSTELMVTMLTPGVDIYMTSESDFFEPVRTSGNLIISNIKNEMRVDTEISGNKVEITCVEVVKDRARSELIEFLSGKKAASSEQYMKKITREADLTNFWVENLHSPMKEQLLELCRKLNMPPRDWKRKDIKGGLSDDLFTYFGQPAANDFTFEGEPAFSCMMNLLPMDDTVKQGLINNNLSINKVGVGGNTPIHKVFPLLATKWTAERDEYKVFLNAIKAGDLDVKNDNGDSPLSLFINKLHKNGRAVFSNAVDDCVLRTIDRLGYSWTEKVHTVNQYDKKLSLEELFNAQEHPLCVSQKLKAEVGVSSVKRVQTPVL